MIHLVVTVQANAPSTPNLRSNPTNPVVVKAESIPSLPITSTTPETVPETDSESKTGESDVGAREHEPGPSTLITTEPETTIGDIVKIVKRLVHRPEVESSLIT